VDETLTYFTPTAIAERWSVSTDTVLRRLEKYRGRTGFMDLGIGYSVRRRKRRYSIIRVHPTLLRIIEAGLGGLTARKTLGC
jgi:hypothetical protein